MPTWLPIRTPYEFIFSASSGNTSPMILTRFLVWRPVLAGRVDNPDLPRLGPLGRGLLLQRLEARKAAHLFSDV
jgi:hypothetical protein